MEINTFNEIITGFKSVAKSYFTEVTSEVQKCNMNTSEKGIYHCRVNLDKQMHNLVTQLSPDMVQTIMILMKQ